MLAQRQVFCEPLPLSYPASRPKEVPLLREFKAFLIKQNVLALAIAVVMGAALTKVVDSVVADFIMPIVGAATPGGAWRQWTLGAGSVRFGIGNFLNALLNFVIVGLVAWRITKAFIKPPAPTPDAATKACRYCRMTIDSAASRCPHCTSDLGVAVAV
jgi:large conductance mechanosensitive channel